MKKEKKSIRNESKTPEDLSVGLENTRKDEEETRAKLKSIRKEIANYDSLYRKYIEDYPKLKESLKYYENKEEELIRERNRIEAKLIEERDSYLKLKTIKSEITVCDIGNDNHDNHDNHDHHDHHDHNDNNDNNDLQIITKNETPKSVPIKDNNDLIIPQMFAKKIKTEKCPLNDDAEKFTAVNWRCTNQNDATVGTNPVINTQSQCDHQINATQNYNISDLSDGNEQRKRKFVEFYEKSLPFAYKDVNQQCDATNKNDAPSAYDRSPPRDPRVKRSLTLNPQYENGNNFGNNFASNISSVNFSLQKSASIDETSEQKKIFLANRSNSYNGIPFQQQMSIENLKSPNAKVAFSHNTDICLDPQKQCIDKVSHSLSIQRDSDSASKLEFPAMRISTKHTDNEFYQSISNLRVSANFLYASCRDGTVKRINLFNKDDVFSYPGHKHKINALEIYSQKNLMFTICGECVLRCYKCDSGTLLSEVKLNSSAQYMDISTEWGGLFLFVGLKDGKIKSFNVENGLFTDEHIIEFYRKKNVYIVKALKSVEGKRNLLILAEDCKPSIINAYTGEIEQIIGVDHLNYPTNIVIHKEKYFCFLYSNFSYTLHHRRSMIGIFDSTNGWSETKKIRFDSHDGSVTAMYHDDEHIYIGLFDGRASKVYAYQFGNFSLKWIAYQGFGKKHMIYAITSINETIVIGDWYGMVSTFVPEKFGPYICRDASCRCDKPFSRKYDLEFHYKSLNGRETHRWNY